LENTLEAFRFAREDGADGVELDVQRCKSGEIVVFHDYDLRRLASVKKRVADLPLAALRELSLQGPIGRGGIPTLAEVLEELGPLCVNIELKVPRHARGRRLGAQVAGLVRRFALGRRALVSSFHPVALHHFRSVAPEIPSGLLFGSEQSLPLRQAWVAPLIRPFAMHPEAPLVTRDSVDHWHRSGHVVNTWTVDSGTDARRLQAIGVDGIITNRPRLLIEALNAH
jgi:glycerophosphoryl diester phosphodiesterase